MLTLPTTLPRRSPLDAHAITCCWWPSLTFNLPPNFTAGNPVPPHPFLIFILFFCPSVLFCFRSLCVCALISPTPLLCHQLGPSVSKSWSHCACLASFFFFFPPDFAHKHVCMDSCGIPQTLSLHTDLHLYYQPLTSSKNVDLPLIFFQKGGSRYIWLIIFSSTSDEYIDAPCNSDHSLQITLKYKEITAWTFSCWDLCSSIFLFS